jgi:hypothetical protein
MLRSEFPCNSRHVAWSSRSSMKQRDDWTGRAVSPDLDFISLHCVARIAVRVAVPVSVSPNVLRLPTAREPTARAAKGCPPPFT